MRRKSPASALVAVSLVVLLLGAGLLLATTTTNTLEAAAPTDCPEGSVTGRIDETTDGRACTVVNTDTTEVTFGVTVRNSGSLPVQVTELPLAPLDLVGFTPDAVVDGAPPFRLGRGEERTVRLQGRLPSCESRSTAGATTFTQLAFRVRTLGVPRQAALDLEPAVRLVSEPC